MTGPIGPGLQNLNATKVAGYWPSMLLLNQKVDMILNLNKDLADTPYTLYRETGRVDGRYYPRPFDSYFVARYHQEYALPKTGKLPVMYKEMATYKQRVGVADLEQRHCMPVTQYAQYLERGEEVDSAMTPERAARLLNKLAVESVELARAAEAAVAEGPQGALGSSP